MKDPTTILKALNVRVVGSGENILVLSHGFGTDQSAWQRILPFFLNRYTVVLYDLVCAGSVNPDLFDFQRYTTLDAFVDDFLQIVDALQIHRCAYVGHSVSAMIGILASIRRPELFSKLILIGASPRFLNDGDYIGGYEKSEIEEYLANASANFEAFVTGFAPMAIGADVPEAVQEFTRTLFNMRPDIGYCASWTAFNSDLRGVLGLVRVPACIIQTAKDMSVPRSVATYLEQHLGGSNTVVILPTEGHLPHLSAPALLAPAILQALSTTP